MGLSLHICFVLEATLPHVDHPPGAVRTSMQMEQPNANHTVDLRRVGKPHSCRQEHGLFLEKLNLTYELNSNADDKPIPI